MTMLEVLKRFREIKQALRIKDLSYHTKMITNEINMNESNIFDLHTECKRLQDKYMLKLITLGITNLLDLPNLKTFQSDELATILMEWSARIQDLNYLKLRNEKLGYNYDANLEQLAGVKVERDKAVEGG